MSSKEEEFSIEEGALLVKFARENIEYYLKNKHKMPVPNEIKQKFSNKYGAFVTLNRVRILGNPLRGCIGYIEPRFELYDVIHRVSISSAIEDPRFTPVILEEMNEIVIEISILTPPELIVVDKPEDYLKKILIGRDGLIAERGARRGLLLPQVPVDHDRNWSVKEFLDHTCQKAMLSSDAWKDKDTKIYAFQAILFEETEPRGKIVRKFIS
ncbi:MAG: TIGR00296 family protein [Candidatus Lokiarchaeota archaeon]|nr:TIGR00296 family protein [Candidatus Lokiarchaeota archaeon]